MVNAWCCPSGYASSIRSALLSVQWIALSAGFLSSNTARSISAKTTLSDEVAVMEGLCEEASNARDAVNHRIGTCRLQR